MSLQLVLQLGIAGLLLFVGVCLGIKAQPRLESPIALGTRLLAIAAAAVLFFLAVAESVGLGPSVNSTFRSIAFQAERLMETWISLL